MGGAFLDEDRDYSEGRKDNSKLGFGDRSAEKHNRLGWKRLTICIIVKAIALGSLSILSVFATLGLVPRVIITVGVGAIAVYTSYLIGLVKLKFPDVAYYADAGPFGRELAGFILAALLILLTSSYVLTGSIALSTIANTSTCALVWSVVSTIVLFLVTLPLSFAEFAFLGYLNFTSILLAIPSKDTSFYSAFLPITNILFAYSFAIYQFSFMDEMYTPRNYALGLIEIFIYTLTGLLVYIFVSSSVESPTLLSTSHLTSGIAFGVAIPVVFISRSINTTVSEIRYTNIAKGWTIWILLVIAITIVAWAIAKAIPVFNALLGLISSLFTSRFLLLKDSNWSLSWKNISLLVLNAIIFFISILVLGSSTYTSV
ncbi:hypothetical protein D0859_01698 [Hortaea werneckii]|uniref:Amino acid transporter transmembrane domain-containing protein n=1 Tax=Hortaea werneckii TaxID=91943 RepID=A0A3M7J8S4_HORWE|nr:hypothetical protein D0859_01698 [Hortaea werneckii]